jgi:hypothetical protein
VNPLGLSIFVADYITDSLKRRSSQSQGQDFARQVEAEGFDRVWGDHEGKASRCDE